jgi:hypothetical protein
MTAYRLMMIPDAMHAKAEGLMAADAFAAWERANPKATRPTGHGRRRFKPYSVPARSEALAKALGTNDAELVASIMLYQFNHKLSEAEL